MDKSISYCQICSFKLEHHSLKGQTRLYCVSCKTFSYLDPKVAVVVIIKNKKTILLVKRDIEPNIGCWSFPSGYVDKYEKTEEAAMREVKEETHLEIKIEKLQGVYSGKGPVIIVAYTAITLNPNIGSPGDEVREIKWFPIYELPKLPFPYDDEIVSDYLSNL
mgnify:CR=1 FL=1|jgi:ADP-ribose pyrophosphatase YjhB (NUDIX family)|tara:strand:- start:940 stop:1428 length:489 start_codon:yes stop_codon:yes gene_type:complete